MRGVMLCGLCGRRMSGKWNHDQAYYQCRFPAEYALANRIRPRPRRSPHKPRSAP
jgi:site-specific DNA recombinase